MAKSVSVTAKACCSREKDRLVQELRACDDGSLSPKERHQCYRWAAKKSGQRSRECLIAG